MNVTEFSRHRTPPQGWFYRQPETGWTTPTPIGSTFSQTVALIIAMRRKNPAITAKYNLATNTEAVESELEKYTRKRLGLPEVSQVPFSESRSQSAQGAVAVAAGGSMAGLKRAAQSTAIPIDWLRSGGMPVAHDLANKRASICIICPKHEKGEWFTVAAGELIKKTIELRSDIKLETDYDDKLQSCGVCSCLLRAKVHCPLDIILAKTKPEILAAFPSNCWIAKRDQI